MRIPGIKPKQKTDRVQMKIMDKPKIIHVEITNYCNLACPMCARTTTMTRATKHMEFDVFKKIVDAAKEWDVGMKMHQFGEAFMHPQVFELLAYAAQRKARCGFSTNATLLTEKNAERLFDSGCKSVRLSLDAATAETYNTVRARPDGKSYEFDRVMGYAERFLEMRAERKSKMRVTLVIVDMPMKGNEAEMFKERWSKWTQGDRPVKLHVSPFTDFGGAVGDIDQFGFDSDSDSDSGRVKQDRPNRFRKACGKLARSMTVQSDGHAVACCYDVNGDMIVGNVKENSLQEIWEGALLTDLREKHMIRDFSTLPVCDACSLTWKKADETADHTD